MVALVSYLVLSLLVPVAYLSSKRSGFGPEEKRVGRIFYILGWVIVQLATYQTFFVGDFSFLWGLPSFGRDIAFVIVMYYSGFAFIDGRLYTKFTRKREGR